MNYIAASLALFCASVSAITQQQMLQQLQELQAYTPPSMEDRLKEQIAALAQQLAPTESLAVATNCTSCGAQELTEVDFPLLKTVTAAVTPLMAHYPSEKLLASGVAELSVTEKLEHTHLIATFVERLSKKFEGLSPEAREFIKTSRFAKQPLGKSLVTTLIALQQLLKKQLAEFKNLKPQTVELKELKKITTSVCKSLDAVLAEVFGL